MRKLGHSTFERGHILRLTDAALMTSGVSSKLRHPGKAFVDFLTSEGSNHKAEHSLLPPETNVGIQNLKGHLLGQVRPLEAIQGEMNYQHPVDMYRHAIDVIESYVTHHVVIPLMDCRLELGHEVFSDLAKYLANWHRLPMPPLMITDNGIALSETMNQQTIKHWGRYVLLLSVFSQLLGNSPVICCPRAYNLIPGIDRINYAHGGSCDEYVANRTCLVWTPGSLRAFPRCEFSRLLATLGFEISSDTG